MYVVTVTFEPRPGKGEAFVARVRRQARDSLEREPGCHHFDVCVAPEGDGRVFLYEIYSDQAAFQVHLESEHFKDFDTLDVWLYEAPD